MNKQDKIFLLIFIFTNIIFISFLFFYFSNKELNKKINIQVKIPFNYYIPNKYTCDGYNINFPVYFYYDSNLKNDYKVRIILKNNNKTLWKEEFDLDKVIEENSSKYYNGPCPPIGIKEKYHLDIYVIEESKRKTIYHKAFIFYYERPYSELLRKLENSKS